MVIGLPDLANKNPVFDLATLNGHQETVAPHKELTIQQSMHSLRIFKFINTFAKTDLSLNLKVCKMRGKNGRGKF